ncbi:unnamed protein product [Taenia asiatica]|uniref:Uncharacterized protein n=1 Tax=Taenia asiatica TaxID=60517 RepID=A0A0R3VYJ9_TAEAS|nr:unnamed protein product [Taenia asiatica]
MLLPLAVVEAEAAAAAEIRLSFFPPTTCPVLSVFSTPTPFRTHTGRGFCCCCCLPHRHLRCLYVFLTSPLLLSYSCFLVCLSLDLTRVTHYFSLFFLHSLSVFSFMLEDSSQSSGSMEEGNVQTLIDSGDIVSYYRFRIPQVYAWQGGALLASTPDDFGRYLVTRKKYEENGHAYCEARFPVT